LVKKYFEKFNIINSKFEIIENKFIDTQKSPKFKLKEKKSDQANVIIGFMSEGRGYKGRFAQSILTTILGGGMSSRLFIEVRERRGLAYAVKPSGDRFSEIGYIGTYAGVDVKKCDEAIKVILDEYYAISTKKKPITKDEMIKAKEYLKGHIALSLEDTQAVGDFFAEQSLFLDEVLTPDEVYKKIDAVTIDEVYFEAVKLFKKEKLNLAIIGPYKSGEKFVKLLQ
jgi:predicted Zn-dependent peptidase